MGDPVFIVPIALNGRINGWSLGGQLGETTDAIFHLVATAILIWGCTLAPVVRAGNYAFAACTHFLGIALVRSWHSCDMADALTNVCLQPCPSLTLAIRHSYIREL